jgi:hypothetical protein
MLSQLLTPYTTPVVYLYLNRLATTLYHLRRSRSGVDKGPAAPLNEHRLDRPLASAGSAAMHTVIDEWRIQPRFTNFDRSLLGRPASGPMLMETVVLGGSRYPGHDDVL